MTNGSQKPGTKWEQAAAEMIVAGGLALPSGDPFVIAGAAGAPLLIRLHVRLAHDFRQRVLSQRESVRVLTVYLAAAERIKRRREQGDEPRTDRFFDPRTDGRSSAEEIAEGILLAAQREYEER